MLPRLRTMVGNSNTIGGCRIYMANREESDYIRGIVMAKPGQVFATRYERGKPKNLVEIGISLEQPRVMKLGQQTDLALAETLMAAEVARKIAAKERDEQRAKERYEQGERRKQTSRSIQDALARLTPLLETLGINPQTVVEGQGTGTKNFDRQGILMPAEAVEQLVRKAIEFEEMMSS